jgi:nucleoside-diphosphate-sugar epimerase
VKVIVTGATGFIGQHLVPLLLQNNYEVIAVARDEEKAKRLSWFNDVQFIPYDFHKEEKKIKISAGDGLIHLAWQGLPNYNALFHFEENLLYSYAFIKKLVLSGVEQVLMTGTCFEYGLKSGPISSNTKPCPINPYGFAKDCLRQYLEFFKKEKSFVFQWARLFYMYGRGQNPNSLTSQLEKAIENNLPDFNMSDGEQLRDYLSVEEVARQIFDLYQSKIEGTYNICSGKPISVRRFVEEYLAKRNSKMQLNFGHYPYPEYEPMAFWGVRDIK